MIPVVATKNKNTKTFINRYLGGWKMGERVSAAERLHEQL
jgi:hypothetical protein